MKLLPKPIPRLLGGCLCIASLWLMLPLAAHAGSVYRCLGPNGQIAFTNRIGSFRHCRKVSHYAEEPRAASTQNATRPQAHTVYRSTPGDSPDGAAANDAQADNAHSASSTHDRILRGAVYKVVKRGGITEYTNIRPDSGAYHVLFHYISSCYACSVHSNINWKTTPLNLTAYRSEISSAAQQYGLDPSLLRAVIHAESAFNPNALSDKGAQGLMQLMPGTASDMGVSNPFNAAQNIRGGAEYLAQLLKQFNGDERRATAAFNAGPQNVEKFHGVPPFDETRVYVDRVATLRKRYRRAAKPAVAAAVADTAPNS